MADVLAAVGVALVKGLAHLPLRVLYVLADAIFVLLYYVLRYRRRMVRANMCAAFPDMDRRALRRNIRGFYRNLRIILLRQSSCYVWVQIQSRDV